MKRGSGKSQSKSTGEEVSQGDTCRIPSGMVIADFLEQEGYPRGTDITGCAPLKNPVILKVRGGKKYEIGPLIARGGMGAIYEARDIHSQRVVALKVLPEDVPCPRQDLLRFIREGQLTSQLEHPNIVPVHELGVDEDGCAYYTMKRVEGRTLTSILQAIRKNDAATIADFPLARLLNIFQKVCDAVAFAHSKNVVHRDLKPDNIMVGYFGEVQVMDWGLAKILRAMDEAEADGLSAPRAAWVDPNQLKRDTWGRLPTDDFSDTLKTISGRVMGTPGFLAPEQILQQKPEPSGERADVYSLGAVLYAILTLRPPIGGGDIKDMLHRIVQGDFPAPVLFNTADETEGGRAKETRAGSARKGGFPHCPDGWIPTALSDIAMKALAANPADRFSCVQELQREIEDYQQGHIWHLVIDDDFSDPESLSRWEVVSGQAEIAEGELRLWGAEPYVLLLRRDVPGDVRIEFECRQEGPALTCIGCFMNSIRDPNPRAIPWSGYEFEYGGYDNTRNAVHRFNEQIWIEPDSPITCGKTYDVLAERMGPHLRFLVNGKEIASLADPDPLSGNDRVALGFVGWNAEIRFTRIRVSMLGTPWKGDVLELAERQIQKGRYDVAIGLFEDMLESFPDAERRRRAEEGLRTARQRHTLTHRMPSWNEMLKKAWPNTDARLQMVNDGLSLDISGKPVETLEPLRGLPLNVLYCAHCGIHSLEPLRGMPLKSVNCTGNPVRSLGPLRGAPLRNLQCENCPITDLEPLRGMALKMLEISASNVSDLEPLRGMPITFLYCWSSRIESLEPLRGMKLDNLNCAGNRIASLEPVSGMPLTNLHCGGNCIRYLEPLRGMPLSSLYCGDNEIEDLSPLADMPLTILGCHSNRITDLGPLKSLELLKLDCGDNPLRDLASFAENPPEDFLFDCDTITTPELKRLHRLWAKHPRYARHAHNAETLLNLRAGDRNELRKRAAVFKGHRYLFIPQFMRWADARKFCEELGGHLVTITTPDEDAFIASLFKSTCWFWLGLFVDEHGPKWVTGEPFAYKNFISESEEKFRGPKAFGKFWRTDCIPDPRNCFMIEWDE